MSKKIVVDGRMFDQSGIGRYIRNLISQLQIIDRENEYFILHLKKDYELTQYQNNFHKVLADFHWYGAKEQIKLPKILNDLKPDLVHFPHFNVPVFYRGKFVVTIHDLIHQHFQMRRVTSLNPLLYRIKNLSYKVVFKNAIKKSIKIIVPSHFVKDQLVTDWKINKEKIIVTPEAVDETILNLSKKALKQVSIKKPYSAYIFYVGNAHPHKNVEGLIKAFLELKEKYRDLKLVLAGSDHYFWARIKSKFQDENIIFAGAISDQELAAYYQNASCFVLPSFEEGFGIPILEAMACKCPVVASNKGALPEVGGNAAIYFDPHDQADMINKISQILQSNKLRQQLINKGTARVKLFSWEKLARQTLEVYLQCM